MQAEQQIGNILGVQEVIDASEGFGGIADAEGTSASWDTLATVTADGVNTITVDTVIHLAVDQFIDIVHTDGTMLADNRKITAINGLVVTYSGADVLATTSHRVRRAALVGQFSSIQRMRSALNTLDPTTYTTTYMDRLSYNDMVYALRMMVDPVGVTGQKIRGSGAVLP